MSPERTNMQLATRSRARCAEPRHTPNKDRTSVLATVESNHTQGGTDE
jgi:hypothetical protein